MFLATTFFCACGLSATFRVLCNNSKTINPHKNYRRYRYCRFLSSVGSWSVDRGAHIQAFTFSMKLSQNHGRLSIVSISKHSCVWCVICVVWGWCGNVYVYVYVYVSCVVRVCWNGCTCWECVWCMCWKCVGCAFCVLCVVGVVMCCVGAGAGVQCVVRGVCVLSVCGAAWHAEKPSVCRLKTFLCVGSKRIRVYRQNARICSTCGRFAGTRGCVLNLHTETFSTYTRWGGKGWGVVVVVRGGIGEVLFSLSSLFSFSLPSFSFSLSVSSLFPLLSSLSPLSAAMTMMTRPVGLSLYTHGSDLLESQSACTLAHSLFGRTCSYQKTVQASCHLEWSGPPCFGCVCLCLVVFVCVWLCLVVFGCVCLC